VNNMKNLFSIALAAVLTLVPLTGEAVPIATPGNYVFSGSIGIPSLTNGDCVIATGAYGVLTTSGAPCGPGGGAVISASTWTLTDESGAAIPITDEENAYSTVGNAGGPHLVNVAIDINMPSNSSTANSSMSLPVDVTGNAESYQALDCTLQNGNYAHVPNLTRAIGYINAGAGSTFTIYADISGVYTQQRNIDLSTAGIYCAGTYQTAS
jgi:hypothetical protein